jgi:hypothetical protein
MEPLSESGFGADQGKTHDGGHYKFSVGDIYTVSPKVLVDGSLIFWFHSHDALREDRASVHVGKGSQDDYQDAKIWLEPQIEVARPGRILKQHELNRAIQIIEENRNSLMEEWYGYKGRAS